MTPVRRLARLGGLLVAALVVASLAAGCSSGGSASIKVTEPGLAPRRRWPRRAPRT